MVTAHRRTPCVPEKITAKWWHTWHYHWEDMGIYNFICICNILGFINWQLFSMILDSSYYLWFREVHYYKALQIVFGHLNLGVIWFPLLSKELKWVNDSLAFVDIYDFNIWILGQGYISWSRWRHYGTNEKHASK